MEALRLPLEEDQVLVEVCGIEDGEELLSVSPSLWVLTGHHYLADGIPDQLFV